MPAGCWREQTLDSLVDCEYGSGMENETEGSSGGRRDGYVILRSLNTQVEDLMQRLRRLEEWKNQRDAAYEAAIRPFSFLASEPRECGFCGSQAVIVGNRRVHGGFGDFWVYCSNENCDTCGPTRSVERLAVEDWNRIHEALAR